MCKNGCVYKALDEVQLRGCESWRVVCIERGKTLTSKIVKKPCK